MAKLTNAVKDSFAQVFELSNFIYVIFLGVFCWLALFILDSLGFGLTTFSLTSLFFILFASFTWIQINSYFHLKGLSYFVFLKFSITKFVKWMLSASVIGGLTLSVIEAVTTLNEVYFYGGLSEEFTNLLFNSLLVSVPAILVGILFVSFSYYLISILECLFLEQKELALLFKLSSRKFFIGYLVNLYLLSVIFFVFLIALFFSNIFVLLFCSLLIFGIVLFKFSFNLEYILSK